MEELRMRMRLRIAFRKITFQQALQAVISTSCSQCTWRLTFQPVSVFHGLSKGLNCVCERGCLADNGRRLLAKPTLFLLGGGFSRPTLPDVNKIVISLADLKETLELWQLQQAREALAFAHAVSAHVPVWPLP